MRLQVQLERFRTKRHMSSASAEFWEVPREEVEIRHEIGSGAWGCVAKGQFRGQEVAVKWPHKALLTPKVTERLRREVQIMAQVRHPNLVLFIAAVFDEQVDSLQAPPLIVNELLSTDMRSAYERDQLAPACKLPIFQDIARALNYLHQHQEPIIHRDISAPNILLEALSNTAWKAKISDFGSANHATVAQTAAEGAIIYAAPETYPTNLHNPTAALPPQTTKIDVYSYGVLLCEVVTNQLPVPEDYRGMLLQVHRQWPPMLTIITSCTEEKPEERPTMTAVLRKLSKVQQLQPEPSTV